MLGYLFVHDIRQALNDFVQDGFSGVTRLPYMLPCTVSTPDEITRPLIDAGCPIQVLMHAHAVKC
jgi:hypothetical protein